ncbi:MAG: sodium:solute symporter [Candidatus Omnitrophota bacterium]
MLNITILTVYLLVIICIGFITGRRVKNIADFAVAGKNYGTLIIFATLSASFIGGGFSTGNAEKVFTYGIANIFFLFGFSLQIILVSLFIAPKMDRYNDAITTGDIIGSHYGRSAKIITGVLSVLVCAGILGAQVGAMGYIFNVFTGIPRMWGIMIGCSIVILYSTLGGMKAVVASDILQFVILAVGIPLTLFLSIGHAGGIGEVMARLPETHFSLMGGRFTPTAFISLFLTFLLGETLVPPYVQRLLLSRDARKTAKGTFYSGLFSLPFFVVTGLIGLVALALNPAMNPNHAMPYVILTALPVGISGIVIVAMISIIMSSADSFLNSASVAIVNDIAVPLKKGSLSDQQQLKYAKITNLAVGVFSVVFALSIESILDILIYAYNFWAPIILVPLVSAVIGLKVTPRHFFAGALGGIAAYLLSAFYLTDILGLDNMVFGVLGNLAVFTIYYLTSKQRMVPDPTTH